MYPLQLAVSPCSPLPDVLQVRSPYPETDGNIGNYRFYTKPTMMHCSQMLRDRNQLFVHYSSHEQSRTINSLILLTSALFSDEGMQLVTPKKVSIIFLSFLSSVDRYNSHA